MLTRLPNGDWIDPKTIKGIRYISGDEYPGGCFAPSQLVLDLGEGRQHCAALGMDYEAARQVMDELAALCNREDDPEPDAAIEEPTP